MILPLCTRSKRRWAILRNSGQTVMKRQDGARQTKKPRELKSKRDDVVSQPRSSRGSRNNQQAQFANIRQASDSQRTLLGSLHHGLVHCTCLLDARRPFKIELSIAGPSWYDSNCKLQSTLILPSAHTDAYDLNCSDGSGTVQIRSFIVSGLLQEGVRTLKIAIRPS